MAAASAREMGASGWNVPVLSLPVKNARTVEREYFLAIAVVVVVVHHVGQGGDLVDLLQLAVGGAFAKIGHLRARVAGASKSRKSSWSMISFESAYFTYG